MRASGAPPAAGLTVSQFLGHTGGWRISIDLVGIGLFSGLFLVPLFALIQSRSARDQVSRVIAANNILNAAFMVLASVLLSEFTAAWLLYLGVIFLVMVMYAPGGVASLIMVNVRVSRFGKLNRFWGLYGGLLVTGAIVLLGAAALIEMVYHRQLNSAMGASAKFLFTELDTSSAAVWAGAIAVTLVGAGLLELVRRRFARAWGQAQEEIEAEIKRREQAA